MSKIHRQNLQKVRQQIDEDITATGTNLTTSRNATTVTVQSDTGTNAAIPSADATTAGILTATDWQALQSAVQPGDNVSLLTNDSGYLTSVNNSNWSGADLSLANGGTGASLTDPNDDRLTFWDDSAGQITWLDPGSGLNISGTTMSVSINNANWSGTDLAVNNGGSGRSSATAYAVLCGGTTSTGAHQSVASLGTTGQILTSNGSGALPTFQDAAGGGGAGYSFTGVSSNISPGLSTIDHDETFSNTSLSTKTITLDNTGLDSHLGKRFHFTASATYGSSLTVTSSSAGLLRDSSNASGPHTVTNGTLTVTVTQGALGLEYYSISGDYS